MELKFKMLSKVILLLFAVVAVKADLVPYTLGGTTIMVDRNILGSNSPLLTHLQNGMSQRRVPGEPSSVVNESETFELSGEEKDEGHLYNSQNPSQESQESYQDDVNDHASPSGPPGYSQNDFKRDPQGQLDINVLPDSQLVYQYQQESFGNPKPMTIDEAAGFYSGQERVPIVPGRVPVVPEGVPIVPERVSIVPESDKQSFYYSVQTPDFSHVSQKIQSIVTSLNEKTAGAKLNDRAPVPIVPPIPDAQSFVNLAQDTQYPARPGDIPPEMINTEGFTGVSAMHMVPKDSEEYDEGTTNLGDFNSFVSVNPIEAITTLGGDSPTEPYFDDQRISDDLDAFGSSNQGETLLTKEDEGDSQGSEGVQVSSSEVTSVNSDNSQDIQHDSEVSETTNEDGQEDDLVNSEFTENDEGSQSTQEPDIDLVTENPSEEQTSIPLEVVLLQKEEELSLHDEEEAQKMQKEQEDQMALEQAMADVLGSLFIPGPKEPEEEEEELGNENNTESSVDIPQENDVSIKDSEDFETEVEKQQNTAIEFPTPSDSTVENYPSISEDEVQELNQEEEQSSSDPTTPADDEQKADEISDSDKAAGSPVALEPPKEEEYKENNEKSEVNDQEAQNNESSDDTPLSNDQEVTSEDSEPPNEANVPEVQADFGDMLQNEEVTQGESESTQADDGITELNTGDENVEDDESLSEKKDQATQDAQRTQEANQLDDQETQEKEQQGAPTNTSGIQGNSQPQTLTTNTGQQIPMPLHESSILTNFPVTRGEPEKASGTSSPTVLHYSSGILNPYPITLNQAAGVYIDNEKIFNKQIPDHPSGYATRHDPPEPDSGLLSWYDRDPINIFDPLVEDKLTGDPKPNADDTPVVIRIPHRPTIRPPTIDNEVNVGRPTIPGHIPRPRPTIRNATIPEDIDEIDDNNTPINTGGAVFHNAQPDKLHKSTCRCGTRFNTKIVNGNPTTIDQFPWMAAITTRFDNFTFCGGSLLNDQYVLTAAHCVLGQYPEDMYVRFGETTRDHTSSVNIDIDKFIIHKKYNPDVVWKDDIALIKLARPVTAFTDSIFPVCLPQGKPTFKGSNATVSGWGRNSFGGDVTQGLMEATVKVLSTKDCKRSSEYNPWEVHKKILCALGPGIDACQGDSGGPLVVLDGDQYTQIGLVSWGIGCAQPTYPGIYTRLTSYRNWIQSKIKGADGCRFDKKKKKKGGNRKKNKNGNGKEKNKNKNLVNILKLGSNTANSGEVDQNNNQKKEKKKNQNNNNSNEDDQNTSNKKRNKNRNKNNDDKEGNEESDDGINWGNLQEALKGIGQIITNEKNEGETITLPATPQ